MSRIQAVLVVLCMILLTGTGYGQSAPTRQEENSIRDLVQQYVAARNNKDDARTRSLFTPDADQLVSSGEWRRGLDAVVQGAMASSRKEAGKSSIEVEAIRWLDRNLALVDGRYETAAADGRTSRKMRTTLIVKRTESGWRITAIRNMLPAPPAVSDVPH